MTEDARAEGLISEMLADPQRFDDDGKAHDLLQRYFAGFPVETLRPMLRSGNVYLERGATFIASELGARASALIDDVVPLVDATDGHTQWYAMEVLAVCGKGDSAERFLPIVRMLDSANPALRALAERLMARADSSQVDAARRYFEGRGEFDRAQRWTNR
jgi:hypothetical protein